MVDNFSNEQYKYIYSIVNERIQHAIDIGIWSNDSTLNTHFYSILYGICKSETTMQYAYVGKTNATVANRFAGHIACALHNVRTYNYNVFRKHLSVIKSLPNVIEFDIMSCNANFDIIENALMTAVASLGFALTNTELSSTRTIDKQPEYFEQYRLHLHDVQSTPDKHQFYSALRKQWWQNATNEQRSIAIEHSRLALRKHYASMTDDERTAFSDKMSKHWRRYFNNMTEDEHKQFIVMRTIQNRNIDNKRKNADGQRRRYANETPDEREKRIQAISAGVSTDIARQHKREGMRRHFDNESYDAKLRRRQSTRKALSNDATRAKLTAATTNQWQNECIRTKRMAGKARTAEFGRRFNIHFPIMHVEQSTGIFEPWMHFYITKDRQHLVIFDWQSRKILNILDDITIPSNAVRANDSKLDLVATDIELCTIFNKQLEVEDDEEL